jgi:hypothetical protein
MCVSADSATSEPVFVMLCNKGRTQQGSSGPRDGNTQISGQQIPMMSIADTGNSWKKNIFSFENFTNKNYITVYDLNVNKSENSGKKYT